MTTTNNTSTSNNVSSNVVAKIFVKKIAKREFKAAVRFSGQWVVGSGKQSRTAIKAVEEALSKLGAPKATWNVIKVEAEGSPKVETPAANVSQEVSAKVETPVVETPKANNSSKAFRLDSCFAWAMASSAAAAKMLELVGVDDKTTLKTERVIAYKVAYVAASRACMKQSDPTKVSKFEKDLAAHGREVVFLDAIRENILNAGFEIAK